MQRVTRSTAVAVLPSPPASPGTPGYFTGGTPGVEEPTLPGYEWYNGIQEEPLAVIEEAGLTPDAGDLTQLLQAIRVVIGKNAQAFTSSGTFVVPVGISRIKCRVWGGGGGGGGVGAGGGGAAGGLGGGYAEGWYSVTPGQSLAVTVGAGGSFGNGTPTAGSPGGTSSVGALLSATGGTGGGLAVGGSIAPVPSGPGVGSGGQINLAGGVANGGLAVGSTTLGSAGGGAFCAPLTGAFSNGTGNSASFPGGGGGGAGGVAAADGAVGSNGFVIIEW